MSRISRNEPVGVPVRQEPIPLQAPGIEAPRFFAEEDEAIALLDIIRGAGSLGQTVREAAHQDRMIRQEAADQQRGLGVRHGRTRQPTIVAEILEGKRPVPEGATFEDFAHQIAEEETSGFDAESVQGFKDVTLPNLVEALNRRQKFEKGLADDETFQLDAEALATIPDANEAQEIIARNAGRFPDTTETERLSKLIVPAMKRAAQDGNTERVEMLRGVLGKRLPLAQAEADLALKNAQERKLADDAQNFKRDLDSRFNAIDGGRDTYQNVRDHLKSIEKGTDATLWRSAMDELNERERRARNDLEARTFEAESEKARRSYDAQNDAMIGAGLGFLIEDKTVTIGNREITLRNGLEDAMNRRFAEIAADQDLDEDQKFAKSVDLASRNGYMPPAWDRTLTAGAIAATEQSLEPGGEEETPPPPATMAGFSLFKRLLQSAPGLLDSKLPGGPTRDFYDLAATLQEDPSMGDNDTRALFEARRILSGPGRFSEADRATIEEKARDITERFWSADAKNWPEVAAHIRNRAQVYVRGGLDPDQAVSRAAESVARGRINLNGWSQPTADANLPEAMRSEFPAIAKAVLQDWATRHGEGTGLDADGVTLRAGMATGFWVVADGRTGFWVGGEQSVFSTADLIKLWQQQRDSNRIKAIKSAIDEQNLSQWMNRPNRGLQRDFP